MSSITLIIPEDDENYPGESLESILTQSLTDIEIICLTNKESRLSDKYGDDERIRVKSYENLVFAINESITESKGEYLLFANSSNPMNNILESLYASAKDNDIDILLFKENNEDNKENETFTYISRIVGKRTFKMDKIGKEIFTISEHLYNKLYRKQFLTDNNITFRTDYTYDEERFFYETVNKAEKIGYADETLYKTSKKTSTTSIEDFKQYLKMQNIIPDLFRDIYYKEACNNKITRTINKYNSLTYDKKEAYQLLREYYSKHIMEEFINNLTKSNKKKFEHVIISESAEEYELLRKVYNNKQYTYKMKRYRKILETEQKKIKNFHNSLISSNSWKLTKIFRIK